jgi:ribose transport system substrate-binding protein
VIHAHADRPGSPRGAAAWSPCRGSHLPRGGRRGGQLTAQAVRQCLGDAHLRELPAQRRRGIEVHDADRAGVPTVIIDSGLQTENIVSFVATDNYKGGTYAADRMGQLLNGKGKVLVLRYAEGSASTTEREAGFIDQIKKNFPEIELVSTNQYAGATRDTAKRASENLLNQFSDQVQGIFTPNESSTAGMLLALQDIGKAGKVSFVGFDSSQTFIDALNADQLQGIVVQNPFNMGYLGVRTMVDSLLGKPVNKKIDTGVMLVTKENMSSPEVHALLHPPLDQYLK